MVPSGLRPATAAVPRARPLQPRTIVRFARHLAASVLRWALAALEELDSRRCEALVPVHWGTYAPEELGLHVGWLADPGHRFAAALEAPPSRSSPAIAARRDSSISARR